MNCTASRRRRRTFGYHINNYHFNNHLSRQSGDWWYRFADDESIWFEMTTERGVGTGEFRRGCPFDEAKAILRHELMDFETMPVSELAERAGDAELHERTGSKGLPVMVNVIVRRRTIGTPSFSNEGWIEERVPSQAHHWLNREIESEDKDCNWQKTGS